MALPSEGTLDSIHRGTFLRPDCESCPLRYETKVSPEGDLHAHVMLVGEAPGEEEEIQGRPFQGRSGLLLNQLLERLGVDRDTLWISNATLCRPHAMSRIESVPCKMCKADRRKKAFVACSWCDSTGQAEETLYLNDKQVLREASAFCRERLYSEVRQIRPRVVVPLGRHALEAFIGKSSGIISHRGGIHVASVSLEPT